MMRTARDGMLPSVGVGCGPCRMVRRRLLHCSSTPRPSLLGEALGPAGSGGRGPLVGRCLSVCDTRTASRLTFSGGALGVPCLLNRTREDLRRRDRSGIIVKRRAVPLVLAVGSARGDMAACW